MISTRFKDKRFLFLSSFPSLFHKRTAFTLRIDRLPAIPSYEQSMPIPFPVRFKSKPLSSSFSSSIVSEERIPLLAGLVARQIFIIQRNSPSLRSFPPTRRFISLVYSLSPLFRSLAPLPRVATTVTIGQSCPSTTAIIAILATTTSYWLRFLYMRFCPNHLRKVPP